MDPRDGVVEADGVAETRGGRLRAMLTVAIWLCVVWIDFVITEIGVSLNPQTLRSASVGMSSCPGAN